MNRLWKDDGIPMGEWRWGMIWDETIWIESDQTPFSMFVCICILWKSIQSYQQHIRTDMNVHYDALTDCVPCAMCMMALMYASTSIFHFIFPVHEIQCVSINGIVTIPNIRFILYVTRTMERLNDQPKIEVTVSF